MESVSFTLVVAVSQRIDYVPSRCESRDALDQRLLSWFRSAGLMPVTVPNILQSDAESDPKFNGQITLQSWLQVIKPDVIVLSGGNDIGEYETRDRTEKYLMTWAREHRLPLLGICRGMQFMASQAGAKLKKVSDHVGERHKIAFINEYEEWVSDVNSYHEWGVLDCPQAYEVTATSEDGVIEAIRHRDLPWEGWMWHPEREHPFCSADSERLLRLINSAKGTT